jgi:YjbE family integral membrane protein
LSCNRNSFRPPSCRPLFAIVLIDLVLAGDNALIIGLVARNLPRQTQRKVIFWGTFGAIAVRGLMAILVVYVLDLPGFMLAGAIALVWIARKLLTPDPAAAGNHAAAVPAATFAVALRAIVVADAVMGVDNVLAIGGAAIGSVLLIVLGLAISVPIIVWGSHLVIRLVDRWPPLRRRAARPTGRATARPAASSRRRGAPCTTASPSAVSRAAALVARRQAAATACPASASRRRLS